MTPTLTFLGAARTVTGSKYVLRTARAVTLVDCGLFQGLRELRALNWRSLSIDAKTIDQVLLTHTHIDHAGYLPRLVREGFSGPIYCTQPTADLADLLLRDSARIQEEDARYANRKGFSKHSPALPLYTEADAAAALALFEPLELGDLHQLAGDIGVRFLNAGHILGATHVEVHLPEGDGARSLLFSGDVGRYDVPLHVDPTPPPPADYLVCESTYGDRLHDATPIAEQLAQAVTTTLERRGTILIPAFAVGRSQLVTLVLRDLMRAGTLPEVPIHIDSPMAVDATRIYSRHLDDSELDSEISADGRQTLFPRQVSLHRSVAQSKRLNDMEGPRIIISSSGMLVGGRVLHHLKRLLPDPANLVVLAGYQAAGTRGRSLLEGTR